MMLLMSITPTFSEARDELIARGRRIEKLTGKPRDQALVQAMAERPHLAAIVRDRDANGNLLSSPTGSASAPLGAHGQLLAMAEEIRRGDPALSVASAYLRATEEHPDLLDAAVKERAPLPASAEPQAQWNRAVQAFAEAEPAAHSAHRRLEDVAAQLRMRDLELTNATAYLEAARLHPELLTEALTGR